MPLCGIEKLYVAQQTADTSAGMTFTTPQYYKNVQELDIKPKTNNAKAYAENRLVDQANDLESSDITVNRYDMTVSEENFLLGQTATANGGTVASSGDEAPFIALLYKAPIRRDGKTGYRYGVIYKTLFTPQDSSMKGLEGKPDLSQVPKLTGVAQPTNWSFKDSDGKEKHPWEYHVDTFDNKDLDDTWFNAVPIPSIATIAALTLSSSTPADSATSVLLTVKPTLTFNNALSNYKGITLLDESDNTVVTSALSVDNTGKIVTITPGINLTAAKTYDIILAGIADIYGQALAPQIIKFTTASA